MKPSIITLATLFVVAVVALTHGPGPTAPMAAASAEATLLPLAQAREQHPTHLITRGPAPQTYNPNLSGNGSAVWYRSAGRTLEAWLIQPNGGDLHPAILYCHHGYALDTTDIAAVQPLVDAGYTVLLPSYRGENGNPGSFEMCYGEVDDARAALNALAEQPSVDRSRMFVVGFGEGGRIAMLLAKSGTAIRGAVACSAPVDVTGDPDKDEAPWPNAPFDYNNPVEVDLRAPARHLQTLDCPVHLYYGQDEDDLISLAQPLPAAAKACGKSVTLTVIPNSNEANVVVPLMQNVLTDFSPIFTPWKPTIVNTSET